MEAEKLHKERRKSWLMVVGVALASMWRTDPASSECVPNGCGDCNWVLIVPPAQDAEPHLV